MSTRLDRLLNLLETGSTSAIRQTAATQIGEIQKVHPYDLQNLLQRVRIVLQSKNWDARTAAGQAISSIVTNVPLWDPTPVEDTSVEGKLQDKPSSQLMSFETFDLEQVLASGKKLLASGGQNLEDLEGLSDDEDIVMSTSWYTEEKNKTEPEEVVVAAESTAGMSARQRNAAKRKAKKIAKEATAKRGKQAASSTGAPKSKGRNMKTVITDQPQTSSKVVLESVVDHEKPYDETCWPFQYICEQLCCDLFNANWEIRHGAGVGLREIFKIHASGAGKTVSVTKGLLDQQNRACLQDYALRLLSIFALDRFGDFISDQVTAPVRETCAQALGTLVKHMVAQDVYRVLEIILRLTGRHEWEVRHGGMLGLKYIVAVRKDLAETFLPLVLPAIIRGLQDQDDDVRSISAGSLLPIAEATALTQRPHMPAILSILWNSLLELDDLSASTASIMNLLAEFYSCPSVIGGSQAEQPATEPLATLVPRLWPFLRHTLSSVRFAALKTLERLLSMGAGDVSLWLPRVLSSALSNLFQNFILEEKSEIVEETQTVWQMIVTIVQGPTLRQAAYGYLTTWFSVFKGSSCPVAAIPSLPPKSEAASQTVPKQRRGRPRKNEAVPAGAAEVRKATSSRKRPIPTNPEEKATNVGASEQPVAKKRALEAATGDIDITSVLQTGKASDEASTLMKIVVAKALGTLARGWPSENLEELHSLILEQIFSHSAALQMGASLVLTEWAYLTSSALPPLQPFPSALTEALITQLSTEKHYSEMESNWAKLCTECGLLIQALITAGIPQGSTLLPMAGQQPITKELAFQLVTNVFGECFGQLTTLSASEKTQLQARKRQLLACLAQYDSEDARLRMTISSSIASAVVALKTLPDKLNTVINALMNAIQMESNTILQKRSGHALAQLLRLCLARQPYPKSCIIDICSCLCSIRHKGLWADEAGEAKSIKKSGAASSEEGTPQLGEKNEENIIKNRGASVTLMECANLFQDKLFQDLPWLWDIMTLPLQKLHDTPPPQDAIMDALQVTSAVVPHLHRSLHSKVVEELLPLVFDFAKHPHQGVRTCFAQCLATICKTVTHPTMHQVLERVLPMLGDVENVESRMGATEALHSIITTIGGEILPYIVFLVVPILGRMSDSNEKIRKVITFCFATLIKLMPLESAIPDPPDLPMKMVEQKKRERRFLEQLLDGTKLDTYALPIKINAELRKYQQEGVNWLGFLNKYKLHGILCDDMGLGKTLQSICIMASDDFYRREQFEQTKSPEFAPIPSLVVCPPTLCAHWQQEIFKFCEGQLHPMQYYGKPTERKRKQEQMRDYDVVIMSYDILRNDIEVLREFAFNYCILDEGHLIKNAKAKITQAVKQIQSNHRLILSGTPVQNNVLELWSLFDFLMPGFLGTERQFQQMYSKPILASKDPKCSPKDQEAGELALEALHRQVLPFLLRRVKEDVLGDLPPKIIQDYYCYLSPLQVRLYEDFSKTQLKQGIEDTITSLATDEKAPEKTTHIFQALQYLRKLCSHPALVFNSQHPEYEAIKQEYGIEAFHSLEFAPKLQSLKQLLNECGIGVVGSIDKSEPDNTEPVVSNHRVLIFAQLKTMLDIIETDLLKSHMPAVSYLRLDGAVNPHQRQALVSKFNADPTIDILLLTTHVGGLGLNLTGADTVIFVEHDWNPMKDLQAMDRAHRIGQKKTVNVYRLITRATLEEKIMGLQKFKLNIASSIVNADNSSIRTMDTNQLLDLFNFSAEQADLPPGVDAQSKDSAKDGEVPAEGGKTGGALGRVLNGLEELWDESQYSEEYNLDAFLERLH